MNAPDFDPMQDLTKLFDAMRDNPMRQFMRFVFSRRQGLLNEFLASPSSRKIHHAYEGGLAFHSISVAKLGIQTARHYNMLGVRVNEELVVAGALIHDIGKIHCYTKTCPNGKSTEAHGVCYCDPKSEYHHSPRASLYHHIPFGILDIQRLADTFNTTREKPDHRLTQKKIDKLLHIILSHHGRKAWSSPVLPQFVEAYIIHSLEMMDAYVEKFDSGSVPSTIYDGINY